MGGPNIHFCRSPDGVRIAYATSGSGPPLVRAANWLTSIDLDWRSPIWSHWFEALSERNTLIRYDIRGSGLSDRLADDLSLESWVHDLESVVDDMGLQRFPILGICQGGATAITFAARHPDRVTGLILYGSYAQGPYFVDGGSFTAEEADVLTEMIRVGWGQDRPAFRHAFTQLLIPNATGDEQSWLDEIQRRTVSPVTAAKLFQQFLRIDVAHLARRVSAPTLVMHSRNDNMVAFDDGSRLASLIPNARFVPLESDNHILRPDEPAWRMFRDEVRGFLDSLTGRDADTAATRGLPDLTGRESEVLELIARGFANETIAATLDIAPKTVRNHVTRIYDKLGVKRRARAVVLAREAGYGRHRRTG